MGGGGFGIHVLDGANFRSIIHSLLGCSQSKVENCLGNLCAFIIYVLFVTFFVHFFPPQSYCRLALTPGTI